MFKKVIAFVLLAISILTSGYIRHLQTKDNSFPFTFDQARDLLEIRIMGTFKDIQIVGPTTSVNGVLLGPGYYYFSMVPFWLDKGNPQGMVDWNIFWFLLSAGAIFLFFYKRNVWLGLLITISYLFAPMLFDTTRYFWNAHSMIYFVVFYLLSMWGYLEKSSRKTALFLGLTAGISAHFEAAFGIVLVLFSLILFIKDRRRIGWFLLGLVPTFLPQLTFEVSHGFPMTKLFITGREILGERLSFALTLSSHLQSFGKYLEGQFILPLGFGLAVLVVSTAFGVVSKYRKIVVHLLLLLVFTFLFYVFLYPHEIKKWYLDGLRVWYVFVAGIGLWSLASKKKWLWILVAAFLGRSVYLTYFDQMQFANNPTFAANDPKYFPHILSSLDWVYKAMEGGNFKAYNYVAETYDFPYVYAYWWYGQEKYGYMPSEVAYLPNQPEYVRMQARFYEKTKSNGNKIALIYERKSDYKEWLKKFSGYCGVYSQNFPWGVSAEIREKCN